MAIRVLNRSTFHRFFTSVAKPSTTLASCRAKSFSLESSSPIPLSPEFSLQSECRKLTSLSNVFQRHGFFPSQFRDFLEKNRNFLDSPSSDIERSLKILLSWNLSRELIVSLANNCPGVLELEFLKRWEMGFSGIGVSSATFSMIKSVLEVSRKFSLGPDDLSMCIQLLKGLGFSDCTVIRLLEEFPMVLMMGESTICDRIKFLVKIGVNRTEIDRIFNLFPGVLRFGVVNKMEVLSDEFKDLGFSTVVVRKEILRDPRVLGLEVGELSRCLQMLRTLKCRLPIKEKIYSEGAFRAGFKVKLRVDCLCRHGLIYREAFKVLWKEPRAILYDIEDIEKKIEFLVNRMKFGVLWLVDVPEYLGVNFDKQIVPRYSVIEYLKSKGGLGDRVELKTLIKSSRLKFYNLYVKPYPECENIFGRFSRNEVPNRHPAGLWKLFKPQKYPESKEDVKFIKSFVESLV